ncbi:MAG TPA: DUF5915 domain-containing protein, partial [Candidatus Dojkabacteria bacterium]|nr:DUF5915 domain-containing protein [Candidatus Dojkabacteria bacterium]
QPCIDNISTWWIRRSRDRFVAGDKDALQNLYATLVRFAKTFAPQMPFISEEMYQTLVVDTGIKDVKESVHLEDYPEVDEKGINNELLTRMEQVRVYCSLGLKIRDDNKIKLRQPLSKVYVSFSDKELFDILKAELNVKEVVQTDKFPTGKTLVEMSEGDNKVVLDIELTEELLMEGLYREVVRTIQNARKETGLTVGEKVNVVMYSTDDKLKSVVDKNLESFKNDVSASSFKWSTKALVNEAKVGDFTLSYELTK